MIVEVPVGVEEPTDIVIVDVPEPGAAIEAGLKLAVAPDGSPEADNDKAELKPPDIVVDIVELAAEPCWMDKLEGESETEKSLDGLN